MHRSSTPDAQGQRDSNAMTALLILALINLLNYYDRMLVVVVSQSLRLEFHLTDTQYGILTGPAFVVVYAIASLYFGYLADRKARRTVIAWAVASWSVMTALCGIANSFWMLALARAGVGVGEGGSNPPGMSLLSDHFPPHRRSMALAFFAAGGMVGLFLSFVLGSWINKEYGWRAVFLVAAIPGLLLSLVTYFMVNEPPRGRFDAHLTQDIPYAQGLRRLASNRSFVWLCVAAAFGAFSSLGMMVWLPQFFIRTHALSVQQVGILFGPAAALGLCAGMVLGGWLGNRLAIRTLAGPLTICVGATALVVPLYLLVLWTPSVTLALVTTFVAMATSVLYAPAYQAAVQNVCEPELRATAAAVSNVVIGIIGQGLLPFSVGAMSDAFKTSQGTASLQWALSIAQLFALVSALLFIRARRAARTHFAAPAAI